MTKTNTGCATACPRDDHVTRRPHHNPRSLFSDGADGYVRAALVDSQQDAVQHICDPDTAQLDRCRGGERATLSLKLAHCDATCFGKATFSQSFLILLVDSPRLPTLGTWKALVPPGLSHNPATSDHLHPVSSANMLSVSLTSWVWFWCRDLRRVCSSVVSCKLLPPRCAKPDASFKLKDRRTV